MTDSESIYRGAEAPNSLEIVRFNPCIITFTGPGLMGKTTLGRALAERTNFLHLDVDDTRWRLFERTPDQGYQVKLPESLERFAMLTSYQANHERARNAVWEGKPVILSATYSREIYHEMLKWLQDQTGVPLLVFLLEASDEQLEIRLQERLKSESLSNTRTFEELLAMKSRQKPMENVGLVRLNTGRSLDETLADVFSHLSHLQIKYKEGLNP